MLHAHKKKVFGLGEGGDYHHKVDAEN